MDAVCRNSRRQNVPLERVVWILVLRPEQLCCSSFEAATYVIGRDVFSRERERSASVSAGITSYHHNTAAPSQRLHSVGVETVCVRKNLRGTLTFLLNRPTRTTSTRRGVLELHVIG